MIIKEVLHAKHLHWRRLRPGSVQNYYSLIVTVPPMPYLVPSGDVARDRQKNVVSLIGSSSDFLSFGSCNFSKQEDATTAGIGRN